MSIFLEHDLDLKFGPNDLKQKDQVYTAYNLKVNNRYDQSRFFLNK